MGIYHPQLDLIEKQRHIFNPSGQQGPNKGFRWYHGEIWTLSLGGLEPPQLVILRKRAANVPEEESGFQITLLWHNSYIKFIHLKN